MVKEEFIKKVHTAFDELNYQVFTEVDYSEFMEKANWAIGHCATLEDATQASKMVRFCVKEWNKIETIFDQYLDEFNSYKYEGNKRLNLINDEQSQRVYYITNIIKDKSKSIYFFSYAFGESLFKLVYKNNKFSLRQNGSYRIKTSPFNPLNIKIQSNEGEPLCDFIFDKNNKLEVKNNLTQYSLISKGEDLLIYKKEFPKQNIKDTAEWINNSFPLGKISLKMLDEKSSIGISQLSFYQDVINEDLEILLFFATATLLSKQSVLSSLF